MIQEREQRTYGTYDGKKEKLHDVMNNEDYRGSLKDAYYKGEKSFDKNLTINIKTYRENRIHTSS